MIDAEVEIERDNCLRTNVMVFSKAAAKVFGLRGCGRVSIYLPLS